MALRLAPQGHRFLCFHGFVALAGIVLVLGLPPARAGGGESRVLHKLGDGGGNFGWAVAGAGDVGPERDGVPDFIVGAPGKGGERPDRPGEGIFFGGLAQVFSGATGEAIHTLYGEALVGSFGGAVASLGDVDADGVPDLLVGAYGSSRTIDPPGYVKVFSGKDGAELLRVQGHGGADRFGQAIAALEDASGDGVPDFAVGAPGVTGVFAGEARAYSGADGTQLWDLNGFEFSFGAGNLGASLALLADVDGDGVRDLAISAPRASVRGVFGVGAVFIVSGTSGAVLKVISGRAQGDAFGHHLASGAGFAAITVLGWGPDNAATGQVQFFSSALAGRPAAVSGRVETQVVEGETRTLPDFFGIGGAIAEGAGGRVYAFIGANGGYGGRVAVDRVEGYALGGRKPARIFTTEGLVGVDITERTVIGDAVASPGDVNGDGAPDLVFGDWGAGYAYLVAVAPGAGGGPPPAAAALKLGGVFVRPQADLAARSAGGFKLQVKGAAQALKLNLKGLPADSAVYTVHIESAAGSGSYVQVGQVEIKNAASGQGALIIDSGGSPPELNLESLAELQGRRVEVRNAAGDVVLWTVVPTLAEAAIKLKRNGVLGPPDGSPNPFASAKLKLTFTGKSGAGVFDIRLLGVDPAASYELWIESAPGSGELTLAAEIAGGRLVLSTKKGQPMPLELYDPSTLSGRRVEVRQGEELFLEGVIP
jgi:hypothetical protein